MAIGFALALGACSRSIYVTARTSELSGKTTVMSGGSSGGLTITIGPRVYAGRWVYVSGPGNLSTVSATAFSGGHMATASGIGIGMPTAGQGSIILSSQDGGHMRCVFDYSQWSSSGVGECQDETGAMYDLQITR